MYGQWSYGTPNQDHRYTVYVIDSNTYNLNPEIKVVSTYVQNQNGYSATNPIQLQYERWYSAVFAVKMASDKTGSFTLYIDGVKVYEINNIQTVVNNSAAIEMINMGGTLAQPAYDSPAHISKWDAILLTDNWQDIVDGGYLSGEGGDTQAPTVPDGLSAQAISSSQINLSWTASTDNVGVTEYRIYRNNTEIATTPNTSYSDTGLSSSTTYTYNVSAYDAAGNNSAQSSSASATTQAGGGSGGNNSNGDTTASGGSGCGFVKDDGKGQGAKGEGLSLMIMLIITLAGIAIARRVSNRFSYNL